MKKFFIVFIFTSFCSCDSLILDDNEDTITLETNLSIPIQTNEGLTTDKPENVGLDMARLESFFKFINDESPNNQMRSLLIARDNKLVVEAYFNGWNGKRTQDLRSATKSITSALIGIGIDQQIIPDENAKVLDFFKEYSSFDNWDERKAEFTFQDFLQMRTGLSCNDWIFTSPGNEEKMYETQDWVKFTLDLPMNTEPGTAFSYCTGAPVTLGAALANASEKSIPVFANENLFSQLSITDFSWEFMPSGRADTGGHLHLLPRDMLKIGLLFQNEGNWNGQQIISKEWIAKSTEPRGNAAGLGYGYFWWSTNWNIEGQDIEAYFASGNGGQLIFVIPQLNASVVFTGGQYGENWLPYRLNVMETVVLPSFQ